MREFETEIAGTRVAGDDCGTGDPVLFLHAGVTDRRVWDETVPRLAADGYRTIRYDTPGFGDSTAAMEPFSLVGLAIAVLDSLDIGDAHFVGLSQGAATAVDVALEAPRRVRTLTLVAPGLSGYTWPRLPGYERRLAAAERDDMHGLALETARLWAPVSFDAPDRPLDFAAQIIIDQAECFFADELEVEEPSAIPRLPEIKAPTLVVLGDRDVDAVTEIGEILRTRIPGARRETIAGADHMLPLRAPDRLHHLLLDHLRR